MSEETVNCKWCGTPTNMLGTKECNGCWELRSRMEKDIPFAEKMLNKLKEDKEQKPEDNLGIDHCGCGSKKYLSNGRTHYVHDHSGFDPGE